MADEGMMSTQYRNSFPSDEFLKKYFGRTYIISGNSHRGEIDTDLHMGLRKLFDKVLRLLPPRILRINDDSGQVDIFTDGVPAAWVNPELTKRGLMKELPPEAWVELSCEFIYHHSIGSYSDGKWWRWASKDASSISIIRIPGTARPRRTLADLLSRE